MFHTNVVEKIKTHILCSITFFFFENRAVYEIMYENSEQPDSPQVTEWRMRIACWVNKATDTNSEYIRIILIAMPLQQLFGDGALPVVFTKHNYTGSRSFISIAHEEHYPLNP